MSTMQIRLDDLKPSQVGVPIQKIPFYANQFRQLVGKIIASCVVCHGVFMGNPAMANTESNIISYSELLRKIETQQVKKIQFDPTRQIAKVTLKGEKEEKSVVLLAQNP